VFRELPKGKAFTAWLYVAFWCLLIFATIPLARSLQKNVIQIWGSQAFLVVVIFLVVVGLIAAVSYLRRLPQISITNYFWLFLVSAVLIFYSIHLRDAPEEALHFVEYVFLGFLFFRALAKTLLGLQRYLV